MVGCNGAEDSVTEPIMAGRSVPGRSVADLSVPGLSMAGLTVAGFSVRVSVLQ